LEARIRIRIEMKGTDPDPHHSDKHDPDPHQSDKHDPDPHKSERQDPQHCLQVSRSIYFSAAFVPHTVPNLASGPPAAYSTVVVCVCVTESYNTSHSPPITGDPVFLLVTAVPILYPPPHPSGFGDGVLIWT
jgi:hypothetical protein